MATDTVERRVPEGKRSDARPAELLPCEAFSFENIIMLMENLEEELKGMAAERQKRIMAADSETTDEMWDSIKDSFEEVKGRIRDNLVDVENHIEDYHIEDLERCLAIHEDIPENLADDRGNASGR
jgi:hypothetical protein